MTDDELVERLKRYFGDHTMQELELIDVVRAATGTDPVTARARVQSLVGTVLVRYPTELPEGAKDSYRFAP
jgi:hypothetical protein